MRRAKIMVPQARINGSWVVADVIERDGAKLAREFRTQDPYQPVAAEDLRFVPHKRTRRAAK